MELKKHQKEAVKKLNDILDKHKLAYLFGLPRVGKSLIALESFKNYKSVLILTKKNAIESWIKYENLYKNYKVINYEKVKKEDPNDYEAVVIDEAHNFATTPRPSLRIKETKKFCKNKVILLLSGTPIVESALKIYPQFSLSSYSPFNNFKNFYDFFRFYGIPSPTYLAGRVIESYTKAKDNLLQDIEKYVVKVTYEDANFNYNNKDFLIKIKAPTPWHNIFKGIKNNNFLGEYPLENVSAVYQALHQYEGGTYKDKIFKIKPKIEWLVNFAKENCNKKIAVMSYFVNEQRYLKDLRLSNVDVYSSTKNCEGVDLSHYDLFILYSFGYSGSKFIQLRDRIVNIEKNLETHCIIPLIEGGIGEAIYDCVSNKKDFNSNIFKKEFYG